MSQSQPPAQFTQYARNGRFMTYSCPPTVLPTEQHRAAPPADKAQPAVPDDPSRVPAIHLRDLIEEAIDLRPWEQARGAMGKAWDSIAERVHKRGQWLGWDGKKLKKQVDKMLDYQEVSCYAPRSPPGTHASQDPSKFSERSLLYKQMTQPALDRIYLPSRLENACNIRRTAKALKEKTGDEREAQRKVRHYLCLMFVPLTESRRIRIQLDEQNRRRGAVIRESAKSTMVRVRDLDAQDTRGPTPSAPATPVHEHARLLSRTPPRMSPVARRSITPTPVPEAARQSSAPAPSTPRRVPAASSPSLLGPLPLSVFNSPSRRRVSSASPEETLVCLLCSYLYRLTSNLCTE